MAVLSRAAPRSVRLRLSLSAIPTCNGDHLEGARSQADARRLVPI